MKNILNKTSGLPSFWPGKLHTLLVSLATSLSVLFWIGACNTHPVDPTSTSFPEKINPTEQENLKSAQEFYERLLENKGKVIYCVIEETTPSDIVHYCFTEKEREEVMANIQKKRKLTCSVEIDWEDEWSFSAQGEIKKCILNWRMIEKICGEFSNNPYRSPTERNFFREKAKEYDTGN